LLTRPYPQLSKRGTLECNEINLKPFQRLKQIVELR
jgi:hypothetical protein